jgi:hypothetical protein
VNKCFILGCCLILTGCGDNPFNDNDPILDTDYARIRIEMERCTHVSAEGSFSASMRWSPRMDCLKHLQTRIVVTGKAINVV